MDGCGGLNRVSRAQSTRARSLEEAVAKAEALLKNARSCFVLQLHCVPDQILPAERGAPP